MLSCADLLSRHSEYLDGRLDERAAEEVRMHLADCRRCARYDRVLRRGLQLLAQQPQVEPSEDFYLRLEQRLRFEDQRAAMRPVRFMAAASVMVAALLALAAWVPVMLLATRESEPAPVVQASPVAAEIAWHGVPLFAEEEKDAIHFAQRRAWKPVPDVHLIPPRYTPVVVESPTAPLNYTTAVYSE